jgi:ribose-phosphate pyrophosphokinase
VNYITVRTLIASAEDLVTLMMTMDALRRRILSGHGRLPVQLVCPFLPYARQDRVMEYGQALGVKVVCDLINGMGFDSVEVWDAHSDVALALLNNVRNMGPEAFVQLIPINKGNTVLVAPDAGALKKVGKVAKALGVEMISATKHRDTKTGQITRTEIHSGLLPGARTNQDFLMVDDICDGGRTFIELARKLRPLTTGKIMLYVTHGIFSKGVAVFDGLIDHIYVANLFTGVPEHRSLTLLPTGFPK